MVVGLVGYFHFFIIVVLLCAITFVVAAFIKIDPEFGKKQADISSRQEDN